MAARASFSSDSRIVKMMPALPDSILLKDHLLDDLSSCSSNGFRSYPRSRQCCTKVRYLIQIDLNYKLPPKQNKFFKNKSKSKKFNSSSSSSSSVLHKASNAVVNAFKKLQFSASRKPKKARFLARNLSRKLSKHGLWKKSTSDEHNKRFQRLNSFEKSSKQKKHISPRASKVSVTNTEIKPSMSNNNSNSNSNSFVSSDSYFTATSDSSTIGGSSKINAARDVEESEKQTTVKMNLRNEQNVAVPDTPDGNAQKQQPSMEKDQFSPVSVLDFPFDNNDDDTYDEDEVTSPFRRSKLYVKGSKQKLTTKAQRTKSLAQLKPVRLEDRIALSESRTHDSTSELSSQSKRECELEEDYDMQKKAIALLQLLKATMPSHHHLFESTTMTESILLGFFAQRIMEGNVCDYTILQEAKDWMDDQGKDMFETRDYKLAYIRDMETGAKWFKYDEQVERGDVGLELEYQVFTSLVEEMLRDFYL